MPEDLLNKILSAINKPGILKLKSYNAALFEKVYKHQILFFCEMTKLYICKVKEKEQSVERPYAIILKGNPNRYEADSSLHLKSLEKVVRRVIDLNKTNSSSLKRRVRFEIPLGYKRIGMYDELTPQEIRDFKYMEKKI